MSEGRVCGRCGAPATAQAQNFCGHCGSELPAAPPRAPPSAEEIRAARFDAVRAAMDDVADTRRTEDAARRKVSHAIRSRATFGAGLAAFAVVFIAISVGGFGVLDADRPRPGGMLFALPFLGVPLLFIGVGIAMVVRSIAAERAFLSDETRRLPVCVADERVHVTRGEHGRTQYYVLLESKSGRRREFTISAGLAASLAPGDMGVASVQGEYLLAFARVHV